MFSSGRKRPARSCATQMRSAARSRPAGFTASRNCVPGSFRSTMRIVTQTPSGRSSAGSNRRALCFSAKRKDLPQNEMNAGVQVITAKIILAVPGLAFLQFGYFICSQTWKRQDGRGQNRFPTGIRKNHRLRKPPGWFSEPVF